MAVGLLVKALIASKIAKKKKKFGGIKESFGALKEGGVGGLVKQKISKRVAEKKAKFTDVKERFQALGKGDIGTALIGTEKRNLLSDVLKRKKKPRRNIRTIT